MRELDTVLRPELVELGRVDKQLADDAADKADGRRVRLECLRGRRIGVRARQCGRQAGRTLAPCSCSGVVLTFLPNEHP